jgi:hypothetical protein
MNITTPGRARYKITLTIIAQKPSIKEPLVMQHFEILVAECFVVFVFVVIDSAVAIFLDGTSKGRAMDVASVVAKAVYEPFKDS